MPMLQTSQEAEEQARRMPEEVAKIFAQIQEETRQFIDERQKEIERERKEQRAIRRKFIAFWSSLKTKIKS